MLNCFVKSEVCDFRALLVTQGYQVVKNAAGKVGVAFILQWNHIAAEDDDEL